MSPIVLLVGAVAAIAAIIGFVLGAAGLYRDMGPRFFVFWLGGVTWLCGFPLYAYKSDEIDTSEAGITWLVGILVFILITARVMRGRTGSGAQGRKE